MYVGISYFLGEEIAKLVGSVGVKVVLGVIVIVAIGLGIRFGVSKWRATQQARLVEQDSPKVEATSD